VPIDFSLKKMTAKVVAKLFLGHYVFSSFYFHETNIKEGILA
jgi:hypothetical protein